MVTRREPRRTSSDRLLGRRRSGRGAALGSPPSPQDTPERSADSLSLPPRARPPAPNDAAAARAATNATALRLGLGPVDARSWPDRAEGAREKTDDDGDSSGGRPGPSPTEKVTEPRGRACITDDRGMPGAPAAIDRRVAS